MIKAIGGVFLHHTEPDILASWYEKYLEIPFTHYKDYKVHVATFPHFDKESGKESYQVFSVMKSEEEGSVKNMTLNLRTENLAAFIPKLKEKGLEVEGPDEHPQGLFAWVIDPAGNRVELWEDTEMK